MTSETKLRIFLHPSNEEIVFPKNSGTFIDGQLSAISQQARLVRSVNGEMRDLSNGRFKQYRYTLSCTDNRLPPLFGLWAGQRVIVEAHDFVSERGSVPSREAVAGTVTEQGGFVSYRPRLKMIVVSAPDLSKTEFRGRSAGWSVVLEEDDFVEVSSSKFAQFESEDGTVQTWESDGKQFTALDFTTSGSFTVTRAGIAKWIRQGGGAAGGSSSSALAGGGGGAGAHVFEEVFLEVGEYTVQVAASSNSNGNSTVVTGPDGFLWTAIGGGKGAENGVDGQDGASGGGGGGSNGSGGNGPGFALDPKFGHDGRAGFVSGNADFRTAGGGGGFSQSGDRNLRAGGPGGPGIRQNLWAALYFAFGGGGGGGRNDDSTRPGTGFGIAGDGGSAGSSGTDAQPNTGSGGGGASGGVGGLRTGGLGSSGRFIVWAEVE